MIRSQEDVCFIISHWWEIIKFLLCGCACVCVCHISVTNFVLSLKNNMAGIVDCLKIIEVF